MSARQQPREAAYLKFAGPDLDEATIAGVAEVLRSGQITSGPWVTRFERQLEAFCGGRPVRVLTSATAAIEVALQLCGVGPETNTIGMALVTSGPLVRWRRTSSKECIELVLITCPSTGAAPRPTLCEP